MLRKETRKAKLLKLIYDIGGEATREQINGRIPEYWKLRPEEMEIEEGVGKPLYCHHVSSVLQALKDTDHYLANPRRGIWKITELGRTGLSRLDSIDEPSSGTQSSAEQAKSDDDDLLELVLNEVVPGGPKQFPEDFLENRGCIEFYEVELQGTSLHLAPFSRTIITSPQGYFRYRAKNPPAAKYILYAHKVGLRRVSIPKDGLTLFRAVIAYEKYCDEARRKAFELFLEFTCDEDKAEELTMEVARRLNLRGKF